MPKTDQQLDRLALRMITRIAPVKWPKLLAKLSDTERNTLERKLDGICGSAALAGGYVGGLVVGRSHGEALRYMNGRTRKVRKALGYQTTHDLTF